MRAQDRSGQEIKVDETISILGLVKAIEGSPAVVTVELIPSW